MSQPGDPAAVGRDDQLIEAVRRGDTATARRLADGAPVDLLIAWAAECRRAA